MRATQKAAARAAALLVVVIPTAVMLSIWLLSSVAPAAQLGSGIFDGESNPLDVPAVGAHSLRVLSPTVLELVRVTAVSESGRDLPPFASEQVVPPVPKVLRVTAGGRVVEVKEVGLRRRVLYAPMERWDLRVTSAITLRLREPLADNSEVEVTNPSEELWSPSQHFVARYDTLRFNPAIHVSQVGYMPDRNKLAFVGYYLGSTGELPISARTFSLVTADTGALVFQGKLTPRPDNGYELPIAPYQEVFAADFSAFKKSGRYKLEVPGLGRSLPLVIDDGVSALWARTYALGIYHQRCGAPNEMPFTRFQHAPCHLMPASIPQPNNRSVASRLAGMSEGGRDNEKRAAPRLDSIGAALYPFQRGPQVDVSGGHHDAGDYGKYTINSAQLIHHLLFAADVFPGVGDLDNLGIPESGDGIGDLVQMAKREAEFLAKTQDQDGGFFFLVQPRDRSYEQDRAPDEGDPQVVFPKNTAATAAATAALAQISSSPRFARHYPELARTYLRQARAGWRFLRQAWSAHGRTGAYQRVSHYGDVFEDRDEIAWAAAELFLATGSAEAHQELLSSFDPTAPSTRRWGWMRLFEGYGCATRSYAFAVASGRATEKKLDAAFLRKAQSEIRSAAEQVLEDLRDNAYATPFPRQNKRFRNAGWYFSSVAAFDLLPAYLLEPNSEYLDGFASSLSYEGGANPNNVTFVTGLGLRRQRVIVNQMALNDRRVLPPSGFPLGNIREGFRRMGPYAKLHESLSYPADNDPQSPYAPYDRWSDSFDVSAEAVTAWQARSLAGAAFLMARSTTRDQPWRAAHAAIRMSRRGPEWVARLESEQPLDGALIVWEAAGKEPEIGSEEWVLGAEQPAWVEAEAQLVDGRRLFGTFDRAAHREGSR